MVIYYALYALHAMLLDAEIVFEIQDRPESGHTKNGRAYNAAHGFNDIPQN
jgi:hypothetical protein